MTRLVTPRVAIFDLDGTLVESDRDLAVAVNEVLLRRHLPTWPVETIRRWVGEGADRLLERALTGGAVDAQVDPTELASALVEFRAIYLTCCTDHAALYPGAVEALEAARRSGAATAILTNKPAAPARILIDHLGLAGLVDGWFGGDSPFGRKPDPAPLWALVDQLTERPAERAAIWMVGDSITDIRVAHAAGVLAVAVRGGYDDAHPIDRCDPAPQVILNSLHEFAELLGDAALRR